MYAAPEEHAPYRVRVAEMPDEERLRGLASTDLATLSEAHGMGPAKAATIGAAFELGRRMAMEGEVLRPAVSSPSDIAKLLQPEMELLEQGELRVLVLDTRNHVLT